MAFRCLDRGHGDDIETLLDSLNESDEVTDWSAYHCIIIFPSTFSTSFVYGERDIHFC